MARAIREYQRADFRSVLSLATPTPGQGTPQPAFLKVPQSPGWWYRPPTARADGGIWTTYRGGLERVFTWCPEVLAHLTARDNEGRPCREYYTVRVGCRVVTFEEVDLAQGSGWSAFPSVDLWHCLKALEPLEKIVQVQAISAPRVFFEEVAA